MIFGAFAIFFTGYPHVWSIYQPYVMEQAGWSQGQASMCFYLALSTFVFGNIVGGRMQNRFKEKTIVWIGGGIFAAGILASTFLIVPTPLPMYLSYGVMQGFGQGMIYTVILATVQRWFPDRTGFASGVVVTANGLCGFFLAPLSRKLLEAEGVQKTFLIIGAAIAVSWILSQHRRHEGKYIRSDRCCKCHRRNHSETGRQKSAVSGTEGNAGRGTECRSHRRC